MYLGHEAQPFLESEVKGNTASHAGELFPGEETQGKNNQFYERFLSVAPCCSYRDVLAGNKAL